MSPQSVAATDSRVSPLALEPAQPPPSPTPAVGKDKCVVLMFDYTQGPDAAGARSTVNQIRQAIQNRGWQVIESNTDRTCRYILRGQFSIREGNNSASMFPGTSIQFAHASAEITLKDMKTGSERIIFYETEKEGGNTIHQAIDRAMRELAKVLIPVINETF